MRPLNAAGGAWSVCGSVAGLLWVWTAVPANAIADASNTPRTSLRPCVGTESTISHTEALYQLERNAQLELESLFRV